MVEYEGKMTWPSVRLCKSSPVLAPALSSESMSVSEKIGIGNSEGFGEQKALELAKYECEISSAGNLMNAACSATGVEKKDGLNLGAAAESANVLAFGNRVDNFFAWSEETRFVFFFAGKLCALVELDDATCDTCIPADKTSEIHE